MRGIDHQQADMYSYISPEARVRADHPLRKIRTMADEALNNMSARFDAMYAKIGRPSIPPDVIEYDHRHAGLGQKVLQLFTFARVVNGCRESVLMAEGTRERLIDLLRTVASDSKPENRPAAALVPDLRAIAAYRTL